MHDYGEHNVTFEQTDRLWCVSGVFDLMEAFFGDREMDLSRQTAFYLKEDPELARMFLRTYLRLLPARPGFQERFPAYMLLDRLVVWEYAQRPQGEPWWDPGADAAPVGGAVHHVARHAGSDVIPSPLE